MNDDQKMSISVPKSEISYKAKKTLAIRDFLAKSVQSLSKSKALKDAGSSVGTSKQISSQLQSQLAENKPEPSELVPSRWPSTTSTITCRTCLTTFSETQFEQLVSIDKEWADKQTWRQVYIELIGPANESRLPDVVCVNCKDSFQRFLDFRTMSRKNASFYLETIDYGQCETTNGLEHVKDEIENDGTLVFVESLPKLVEEEKPMEMSDSDSDSEDDMLKSEKVFMDENEWVEYKKNKLIGHPKFLCPICGHHGHHKSRHMKMHQRKGELFIMQCPRCPRDSFKTEAMYHNHLKWGHKQGQEIKCKFCDLVFSCYTSRTSHEQEVHDKLEFVCEECNKRFKNGNLLRVHQRTVHRPPSHLACDTCGKTFARSALLQAHTKLVHTDVLQKCDQCDFTVKTRKSMMRHYRIAHPPDGKMEVFKCDLCGGLYRDASTLRYHMATVHEKRPLFGCSMCVETFSHARQLRRHIAKRHAESEQPPNSSQMKQALPDDFDHQYFMPEEVEFEVELI